jgi:general secretion pathway protein K
MRQTQAKINLVIAQRGAALLVALLVLFLVSVIAVAVNSDFQILMRRADYQMSNERNQPLFRAAEAQARKLLLQDGKKKAKVDYNEEAWAQPFQLITDNITVRGQLIDLQGRFNVNTLAEKPEEQSAAQPNVGTKKLTIPQLRFIRLLQTFKIEDLDFSKATALTEAISDYLDDDNEVNGYGGAEDDYYADQTPPSRAANKTIADISELRLVKGMTDKIYRALEPHITIWPLSGGGEINAHTATRNVLATINNDADPEPLGDVELDWLEDTRDDGHFPSLDVFKQGPFQGRNINQTDVGQSSDYFLLITEIEQNGVKHHAQAVIYRGSESMKVVNRTISGYALPQAIAKAKAKKDKDDEFELSAFDDEEKKSDSESANKSKDSQN